MARFFVRQHFSQKQGLREKDVFLKKCLSTFPKRIRPLTLIKEQLFQSFSHIFKEMDHERAQFTLAGLFPGFTAAANFSRADPGAKRRK